MSEQGRAAYERSAAKRGDPRPWDAITESERAAWTRGASLPPVNGALVATQGSDEIVT